MTPIYKIFDFYRKLFVESAKDFFAEHMLTHAAAISYYTVFSLPSILLIVLWVAAQFYREVIIHEAISQKMTSLIGEQGTQLVMSTLEKLSVQEPTWLTTLIGLGVLLFFATTVFDAMGTALDQLARIEISSSVSRGIWLSLRVRIIALALLVGISFLLLVSLMLDIILSSLSHYLAYWVGSLSEYVLKFDFFLLDFIAAVVLFALYFRYLPTARLKWADSFIGAFLTASLFALGKSLISMFVSNNQVVNIYDAAGSLLILMLWVYYASAIFLFGATFTFNRARLKSETLPYPSRTKHHHS